jgi:PAS domain S-box-containing protein
MVEQLGSLDEIGADYYIAKGPIDKLTVQLNGLMAEIETHPQISNEQIKIMQTGSVYPRRDAVGLLNALKFHQAVIENLAIGVMVVDTDARIVNANAAALEMINKSPTEVLNRPVMDIFPPPAKPKLGDVLNQLAKLPEKTKMSFLADFNCRPIRASISIISQPDGDAGWVLALQDSTGGDNLPN